ncbi:MAG: hypothetical protein ACT4PW_14005 [Acidimicrobiia bacterium]
MGKVVLVGGAARRTGPVREVLEAVGCAVSVADHGHLGSVCAQLGPNSVDAYLQMPVDIEPQGQTVVALIHQLLEDGLMARFEDVSTVFPVLRQEASVVLVSGNLPADGTAPDDQEARLALLRVLGHAILADARERKLRVVVVDHETSAADIARLVVEGRRDRARQFADLVESNPEMDYDDWRLEVMRLASIES